MRILFLDHIIDEDCLCIPQFLRLVVNLLRLINFIVLSTHLLRDRRQNNDLACFHNVDTVERFFTQGRAANKVDLSESVKLVPLFSG